MKCSSGVGFDPQVAGQRLTFDVSGLYKGVFIMRDRQTGTIWAHLDGNASQGPLQGERLRIVPLPQITWGEWKAEYPDTLVLDPDTPFQDRYTAPVRIGMAGRGEFMYGDDRLPSNALVVVVEVKGDFVGFPVDLVHAEGGVVNTEAGGQPVVVLYDAQSQTGIAYIRIVSGQSLVFVASGSTEGPMRMVDGETGSLWDIHGKAVSGPLAGATLTFVPSLISEWYGWSAYHPKTELYLGNAN